MLQPPSHTCPMVVTAGVWPPRAQPSTCVRRVVLDARPSSAVQGFGLSTAQQGKYMLPTPACTDPPHVCSAESLLTLPKFGLQCTQPNAFPANDHSSVTPLNPGCCAGPSAASRRGL